MNKKLGLFAVIICFSLTGMQMSFAQENYTVFTNCNSWDNESIKDIGEVQANIEDPLNLVISVAKAYPTYEAYVDFTIEHMGSNDAPVVYLSSIDISNPYQGNEMDIELTDSNGDPILIGTSLDPGDTLEGIVTITVLNEVDENNDYSFSVGLTFSEISPI